MKSATSRCDAMAIEVTQSLLRILWEEMFDEERNHRTIYRLKPDSKFGRTLKYIEGNTGPKIDNVLIIFYRLGLFNKIGLTINLLTTGVQMLDSAVIELNTFKEIQKIKNIKIMQEAIDSNTYSITDIENDIAMMKRILFEKRLIK